MGIAILLGCHQLTPKQQEALDLFGCRERVLLPYVGDVLDTAQLVREFAKGQADLGRTLTSLGYASEEVAKVRSELEVCELPWPPLVAPPPAPGNKVL
jgi:hypothetical protein